ncbi:nuclear ribonuclease Z, putative [Medicago truncatula]|uniref:Nuclear ribonuclease Z, putative n=1 Tax=Medicago truncatula TaxID=3880 RepID=G7K8Q6_MEDTR|nr:nuclear ribonuclease Z, putative [Medicago truncatula]
MELGTEKKLKSGSSETESKKKSKGLNIEGYQVESLSIGGHEICVIFSNFRIAFDIGRCPPRFVSMDFLLISHAHMFHIVSFSLYFHSHNVIILCSVWIDLFA